jgi:hypothetical protein
MKKEFRVVATRVHEGGQIVCTTTCVVLAQSTEDALEKFFEMAPSCSRGREVRVSEIVRS